MTKSHHVLLRAVAHSVTGADVLYLGAEMLTSGRNAEQRAMNLALCVMVSRLLGLTETDPELMERVLRDLPIREWKEEPR